LLELDLLPLLLLLEPELLLLLDPPELELDLAIIALLPARYNRRSEIPVPEPAFRLFGQFAPFSSCSHGTNQIRTCLHRRGSAAMIGLERRQGTWQRS
jgi:hypothetical protein